MTCLNVYSATSECAALKETVPRGVTCLHCMEPRAKAGTPLLVSALEKSCLKNIAIGFVLDGSFGLDQTVIKTSVSSLLRARRNVTLHLYILNGSAMRKADSRLFTGFANNIPPAEYRRRIVQDKKTQRDLQAYVSQFAPLIRWAISKGVAVEVSPMLEDNFDNQSFNTFLKLTKDALPKGLRITWVRNSCVDCYPGNQSGIPKDTIEEDHRAVSPIRRYAGVVSNDGWGFVYFTGDALPPVTSVPIGARAQMAMRLNQLTPLKIESESKGAIFLLWLSKFQSTEMGQEQVPVTRRAFPLPTLNEIEEIARFLQ